MALWYQFLSYFPPYAASQEERVQRKYLMLLNFSLYLRKGFKIIMEYKDQVNFQCAL